MTRHLELPHRRYNPLTGEYVLCSPHRAKRPWQGQRESVAADERPQYDPDCYLCPGNERTSGSRNEAYTDTYVFENDFRALLDEEEAFEADPHPLFDARPVRGTCRVLCFSPRHDLSLARMPEEGLVSVIQTWKRELAELGKRYRWVQLFENKGSAMGCSNPHPHGQIWAMDSLPTLPAREDACQLTYLQEQSKVLLVDYAQQEIERGERIVCENEDWLVVVPYWATWPFETLLLPRSAHLKRLTDVSERAEQTLAAILKQLLTRYDALFDCDFPYSMGWHGAPFNGEDNEHWQLHAHFYPPLLRSATVKKFMVGFEMLGEAQRDLTPETAAERLRDTLA